MDKDSFYDCGFSIGNDRFRYRAAAIIVEDGYVLFASNEREDYFYSVGGAVHVGESAEDAVLREVFEETGVHYEIDHLAVINENFFDEADGCRCHEVCLYFMMKPRGSRQLNSSSTTCGVEETMNWIRIEDLDSHKAYPAFLREYLSKEHAGIEHIITDERDNG